MTDNSGEDKVCYICGCEGNTAHGLSWDELAVGWVCDWCREPSEEEFVQGVS